MSAANLLEIESLNVAVGAAPVIKNVSLKIGAGEILGLVGASGSGKSMTALAIMRLLPAAAAATGTVRLRGEPLNGMSDGRMQSIRGRDIGMVFQEPMTALNPLMRIGDQVAETLRVHRSASKVEARSLARATLDLVGLSGEQGDLGRLPYELSGGQRQRAAIAMAVIMAPPLLIADEPTTALDVITQAQVLLLLKGLVRTRNMGLLLISHDLAVIAQLADRVAVMQAGQIVEQGTTLQVLRDPVHPYTASLLAAAKLPSRRGAAAKGAAVLQACGIVHEYPRKRRSLWHAAPPLRAVDGVSLTVHAGEAVGLVGESGSGKSSLLRVLLALERCSSGQVRLLGDEFSSANRASLSRLRRAIQAVFQDPYGSFDPRWPVERLIAEPFFLLDTPPDAEERRRRVGAMLEQVGLSAGDARRYPHEFSGGERQRIAIARALITEPKVIALDEAVSALDVLLRDQILTLLAELKDRLKVAYLFVSHDLHVIRALADRVYVMHRGRIVEEGPTEELFAAPRHDYTRALIAATPEIA
ncbi:MAG TPA: ABC transporter ATP-binding protein [Steroidobacteraceae bacterium]|jgi:peptide/nickel transport system ATP-binding protein|nr:ABC transporter ATP-binding protein [Steroidobacteraceae bacterium]